MKLSGTKVYMARIKEVEDEKVFQTLYETVSKKRQEKIDRLRLKKDKQLSLAAEVLLGKVLKMHGIREWQIENDENGKPYLAGMEFLKFNLSHSEERVMCVISEEEVGCDVEYIKTPDFRIADRFFAREEGELLKNITSESGKKDFFYRLWTLKESFVKAVGLGMGVSFKDFCILFRGENVSVCQNVNGKEYYFKEYDLKDGYKYGVCSEKLPIGEIEEVSLLLE